MIELTDKNITIIITTFHILKKLNRDTEDMKKTQIKLVEMKTTMSKMKITVDGLIRI